MLVSGRSTCLLSHQQLDRCLCVMSFSLKHRCPLLTLSTLTTSFQRSWCFRTGIARKMTVEPTRSPFDDLPLDRMKNTLQLWKFVTDTSSVQIQVKMSVFSVDDNPEYVALSYCWGSWNDSASILVNGLPLSITKNLNDFLGVLCRQAACKDEWFWADQISMNQQNIAERNHQVGQMSKIYTTAAQTFAYLGPERTIDSLRHTLPISASLLRQGQLSPDHVSLWLEIFCREYWTRLWIVQELHLSSHLQFWYGFQAIGERQVFQNCQIILGRPREVLQITRAMGIFKELALLRTTCWWGPFLRKILLFLEPPNKCRLGRPLEEIFDSFSDALCQDKRDIIYGLQSLVAEHERVPIDYSKTFDYIVAETMAMFIMRPMMVTTKRLPTPHSSDSASQTSRRLQSFSEKTWGESWTH